MTHRTTTALVAPETLAGLREQEILLAESDLLRQLINEIEKLGYTTWFVSSRSMFRDKERNFAASVEVSDSLARMDIRASSELSPEDALAKLLLRLCQLSSPQSI